MLSLWSFILTAVVTTTAVYAMIDQFRRARRETRAEAQKLFDAKVAEAVAEAVEKTKMQAKLEALQDQLDRRNKDEDSDDGGH